MANPGYVVPIGTQTKEGFHALRRTTEGLLYYTKVDKDSGETLDFEGGSPSDLRGGRQLPSRINYVDEELSFSSIQYFTGDGSTTTFTLSTTVLDDSRFAVYINGVRQNKTEVWTYASNVVTFVIAPFNGSQIAVGFIDKKYKNRTNDFYHMKLPWDRHPDRDQAWFEKETRNMSRREIAQELECNFNMSGETVFASEDLEVYYSMMKDPKYRTGFDRNLWIWEEKKPDGSYIISADVARGDGKDYSVAHVFKLETMEIVAEYQGKPSLDMYSQILYSAGMEFGGCLLVVENNNIGWATLQTIIDRGYENLFYQEKNHLIVDDEIQHTNRYRHIDRNKVPGFTTTLKTKPLVVAKMEEYTREKMVKLKSTRLIDELFVFIYKNSKTEALEGYNDDLVMSYSILLWIRDTAIRIQSERNEFQSSMLGAIGNLNERTPIMTNDIKPKSNPYEIEIKGEKEDLSWLLG